MYSACCPRLLLTAKNASWSQLLPGNTMTPNFMVSCVGGADFSLADRREKSATRLRSRHRLSCENRELARSWRWHRDCDRLVVMRMAIGVLALAMLAAASGEEKFAGTWEATSKGTVFLVLKVKAAEKISGTLNA